MEYTDELYKEFPKSMPNCYCGAYYGKGWHSHIKEAISVIEHTAAKVVQIKEKFGGLRIYIEFPEGSIRDVWEEIACQMAISNAERKCKVTCETCGEAGKKSRYGVTCEKHTK